MALTNTKNSMMKITVPATVQSDSIAAFKAGVEKRYGITASIDNHGFWTFEGPVDNIELVVQDFMQLKPLSCPTL